jgi:hypothetical protein
VTALAAGSHSEQNEALFTIADGVVWHRSWSRAIDGSSDWSEWDQAPLPGALAVDIACTSSRTGHFALFALGSAGEVYARPHFSQAGSSGWERVPAPGGRRLTAITAGWDAGSRQAALFGLTDYGGVSCGLSRLSDLGQPTWSWRDLTG